MPLVPVYISKAFDELLLLAENNSQGFCKLQWTILSVCNLGNQKPLTSSQAAVQRLVEPVAGVKRGGSSTFQLQ